MKTQNQKLEKKTLRCTNCNSILDVDELLINQFQESIKKDLQSELDRREQDLKKQKELFSKQSLELEKEKEEVQKLIDSKVSSQLKSKEQILKNSIRKQLEEERSLQLQELEDELKEKSKQLIELNQTKAKMQRLSREYEEKESKIYSEYEDKLQMKLKSLETNLKDKIEMENSIKLKEKETTINQLRKKLEEATLRVNQGSMQIQGESQEQVLTDLLRDNFKFDLIADIKVGAAGADVIQTVRTQSRIEAGKILYESKRTKNWSNSFIKTLKTNNLKSKCDLMVLVTQALPPNSTEKFFLHEGVWVTTMEHIKELSLMLRYAVLKTHSVMITQTDKKDKMTLLYNYLSSDNFKATFESILESFKSLQDNLHDEQRKMQLLWKRRQKNLSQALESSVEFYSSIKSISENSIPTIEMLEIRDVA